jgi:hypothetical protein
MGAPLHIFSPFCALQNDETKNRTSTGSKMMIPYEYIANDLKADHGIIGYFQDRIENKSSS